MDREQWLLARRQGIGSSDAAAVCGVNPWSPALEVYLDKIGQLPLDRPMTEPMRLGVLFEPVVAAMYEDRTGCRLEKPPTMILQHPAIPWMLASLDRIIQGVNAVVEIKIAGIRQADEWGEPGTDEVPEHYLVQVNHQLAVTGYEFAEVAVLIAGQDFRTYHIHRNETLINEIVRVEAEFWGHVQRREPPEPDWDHDATPRVIKAMHGFTGPEIEVDDSFADLVGDYQRLGEDGRSAEKAREIVKAKILLAMGDASAARLPDRTLVTRKKVTVGTHEVKEFSYPKIHVHAPKLKKVRTA
jgi:putative phage-type endonuclease